MSVSLPREQHHPAYNLPQSHLRPPSGSDHKHHQSLPPAAGSYKSGDSRSQSFLNLTSSALAGVFGSHASLSELAGDDGTSTPATLKRASRPNTKSSTSSSIDSYKGFLDDANKSLMDSLKNNQHEKHVEPSLRRASLSSNPGTVISRRASLPAFTPATTHRLVPLSASSIFIRFMTLFAFGIAYGVFARQIYFNSSVATSSSPSTPYLLIWGAQGVAFGFALPLLDYFFSSHLSLVRAVNKDWSMTLRAVFAFLGLGLGVRKLQIESDFQASAHWGLMTPFVWYLLDGTRNGFLLSCVAAALGKSALYGMAQQQNQQLDTPAAAVWVASVYFCCSICVGNIGRRILAVESDEEDQ